MTLLQSDVQFKYSGGVTNTNPTKSIGGQRSIVTSVITDISNNVWPDVKGTQARDGSIAYRCLYLYNFSTTSSMTNITLFITQNSQSVFNEISIGKGTSLVNGIEQLLATEFNPPLGVAFSKPDARSNALQLGTLQPNQSQAFWIRRETFSRAPAMEDNYYILRVECGII